MIVIVIIGIGYLEGPLLGSILFFALQRWLVDHGVWYLVLLGAIAVAAAVWLPRGLWGVVSSRGVRLLGVGYRLDVKP
jgi:branched-chain amino acid transport system permease protein